MNTIDMILKEIGQPTDGLGPNWSPLERVVHKFHMKDLWAKIRDNYDMVEKVSKLTAHTDIAIKLSFCIHEMSLEVSYL